MRKIKIFKSIESEYTNLENEVNQWLEQTGVKLIDVTGNIAPNTGSTTGGGMGSFSSASILLVVIYEA